MTVDSYRLASLVHLAKDGGGIPVIVRLDDWWRFFGYRHEICPSSTINGWLAISYDIRTESVLSSESAWAMA
jgi:hypothetical protein